MEDNVDLSFVYSLKQKFNLFKNLHIHTGRYISAISFSENFWTDTACSVEVIFEVFVNNTNLTFLSFLYKISIEVSYKNKVTSSGI